MFFQAKVRNNYYIFRESQDFFYLKLLEPFDSNKDFPTARGLLIHRARWCDGGRTVRSRKGSLADKAVQHSKRKAKKSELDHVMLERQQI